VLPVTNNHYFIDLFEHRLSEFTGAPYVVLVDSCSNAIFLSLKYLQRTGKLSSPTITIPNRTYISVPQAVINAGIGVAFHDDRWMGQYHLHGSPVIDAAVGFTRDMYAGGMVCLSFQQKKALSIGKGGAILLDSPDAASVLRRMSWDGRDASKSVADDLPNIIPGYHMNMIPDDAATGIMKLNNYTSDIIGSYLNYPDISGWTYTP
jgi:dTDP-4-amino-4,6-dideoxygalactose transaminase